MINLPVGSDATLPVMGSQDAKMWWDRIVGSGVSLSDVSVGEFRLSGCTKVSSNADAVVVNLVERWFFRVWSRWPLYMAIDSGAYWRTSCDVSSGHVLKWPESMALHQVESDGEKQQAW